MSPFAIFVTVKLKPGCLSEYLEHIERDAAGARHDEPGCQLFHILLPEEGENIVHLYEVYDSEESFNAHQQTPHFTNYFAATESLVEKRLIQRLSVV